MNTGANGLAGVIVPMAELVGSITKAYQKDVRIMRKEQIIKNLGNPTGTIDVVLDTDAYNEIDDQFAISYMLRSTDRLNIKGICAAPFFNNNSSSPGDGMIKSYNEIKNILRLAQREDLCDYVYKGAADYFGNCEASQSDASVFMAETAKNYTPGHPLYIVAIGAITNVALAFCLNPEMKESAVVIWLGGNSTHFNPYPEFNMMQDIKAARIIFDSGVPLVQIPCAGVADRFTTSRYELEHWILGKNPLCDYLVKHTVETAESYASGKPWTRVIWDVVAVAFLLNENDCFMSGDIIPSLIPEMNNQYSFDSSRHPMRYITNIHRDELYYDLFTKLAGKSGS